MKYNIRLRPDEEIQAEKIKIGKISALMIRPKRPLEKAVGILWIHGGGYITGMKEMVYMSRAIDLVKKLVRNAASNTSFVNTSSLKILSKTRHWVEA